MFNNIDFWTDFCKNTITDKISKNAVFVDYPMDLEEKFRFMLDILPDSQYKGMLKMRYLEGKTLQEIGDSFGLKCSSVKNTIDKAFKVLICSPVHAKNILFRGSIKDYRTLVAEGNELESLELPLRTISTLQLSVKTIDGLCSLTKNSLVNKIPDISEVGAKKIINALNAKGLSLAPNKYKVRENEDLPTKEILNKLGLDEPEQLLNLTVKDLLEGSLTFRQRQDVLVIGYRLLKN